MGMGRLFYHWGARVEKHCSQDKQAASGSRAEWSNWCVSLNDVL